MIEMLAMNLPEPLQFLNRGWWITHLVAIPVVFLLGMASCKKCKSNKPSAP